MAWVVRISLLVLLLGGMAALSFLFFRQEQADRQIDPETFCNVAIAPPQIIAIGVDSSDPFTEVQIEAIRVQLSHALDQLPAGGLVEIYRMSAARGELTERLISVCNPGEQISFAQLLSTTSREEDELRSRYSERFVGAVQRTLRREAASESVSQSFILESIHAIGVQSFERHPEVRDRRLIIVSDMLQNSDLYSHYRDGNVPISQLFSSNPSALFRPDLDGVVVDVLVVERAGSSHRQTRELLAWWEDYFRGSNAMIRQVRTIA